MGLDCVSSCSLLFYLLCTTSALIRRYSRDAIPSFTNLSLYRRPDHMLIVLVALLGAFSRMIEPFLNSGDQV